ncbi:phage Gp37/Gp68 family protein [Pararhodobacter sp.]|uniref:DUF5131 family protein n=1 Tax=Pararhodobacter sp. TaxID=2127056 RepID=UPI002AFF6653|nr:phage Gp37/Gp68 family protein [Pararhodobacter sp.]
MADRTPIEWADATWNPITGCSRVSEGCRNCYAEIMAARFSKPGQWGEGLAQIVRKPDGSADHRWTGQVRLNDRALDQPLRWRKPRRIFVCSTSDLFHEGVPDEWLDRVFAVMALAPQHTFMVLTKRPERAREYVAPRLFESPSMQDRLWSIYHASRSKHVPAWPLPNVWLGTSIEDQATADARIPHLLATPAAVRFVSAEPLLGPVDLTGYLPDLDCGDGLDLAIVGGESGPGARPMHPDWPRALRDQCVAAGTAFFFKQWGEWAPATHDPEHGGYVLRQTEKVGPFDSWRANVFDPDRLEGVNWRRLGKKAAGRLLDGQVWDQMPEGKG